MTTISYRAELIKRLKNSEEAAAYLTACYEDSEDIFLLGLRDVVEARGGIGKLSKKTALNRINLYRSLSKKGNPKLSSLTVILEAVGLQLQFSAAKKKRKA